MTVHYARVLLSQARHFRQREKRLGWPGGWSAFLLDSAGRARREYMANREPVQGELL